MVRGLYYPTHAQSAGMNGAPGVWVGHPSTRDLVVVRRGRLGTRGSDCVIITDVHANKKEELNTDELYGMF